MGRVLSLNGYASRCGSLFFNSTNGGHWSLRETTMTRFAERLVGSIGRPVVDRTALDGAFDIELTFTPDNPVVDASNAPNAPSFITALREQLGLRLESTRSPVEVLVIDRVQQPKRELIGWWLVVSGFVSHQLPRPPVSCSVR